MRYSFVGGEFVPTTEISINVNNDIVGTVRGFRIFTACRTVGKSRIFKQTEHIERLYRAAAEIHMEIPETREEIASILQQVLEKNQDAADELLIEIVYTGGKAAPNGVSPAGPADLIVLVFDLVMPPPRWYEEGIALASFPHQRVAPTVKLMFYLGAVMAHQTVVKEFKADEALFVDPSDNQTILEGTTFSFFLIDQQNRLLTPPLDGRILDSITRRTLIELVREQGKYEVIETKLTLNDLKSASGAFLTSSTRNLVPIVRVDDVVIGEGKPTELTQELMELFKQNQNHDPR